MKSRRQDLVQLRIKQHSGQTLSKDRDGQLYCQACRRKLEEHKGNLVKHIKTSKHQSNVLKWNDKKYCQIAKYCEGKITHINSKYILNICFFNIRNED